MDGAVLLACLSLLAVDGDTFKCDGESMRPMGDGAPHVSGFDTPEIWTRKCQKELELARKAKKRLQDLLNTAGVEVWDSGERDKTETKRRLVWVVLPGGRTAGSILIEEGHARIWKPKHKNNWCG
ncbi:endonuclease YncB(thermonuclease family) [Labrenzia sp. EL_126]|nr:endonuclease YncB(thermonuclease family) [Labrenzia sp. EL_126]